MKHVVVTNLHSSKWLRVYFKQYVYLFVLCMDLFKLASAWYMYYIPTLMHAINASPDTLCYLAPSIT